MKKQEEKNKSGYIYHICHLPLFNNWVVKTSNNSPHYVNTLTLSYTCITNLS